VEKIIRVLVIQISEVMIRVEGNIFIF